MNTYRYKFKSPCPVNGVVILYRLELRTPAVVMVEDLIDECLKGGADFHEAIADRLHAKFGGHQTIVAQHHGVQIETTRGNTP